MLIMIIKIYKILMTVHNCPYSPAKQTLVFTSLAFARCQHPYNSKQIYTRLYRLGSFKIFKVTFLTKIYSNKHQQAFHSINILINISSKILLSQCHCQRHRPTSRAMSILATLNSSS